MIKNLVKISDIKFILFYGPEYPVQGCEIQFLVSFLKFSDETEF